MTLYLKNATFIDWQSLAFESAHMAVHRGLDGGCELLNEPPHPAGLGADDRLIDCSGRLVTKSFGCGHHHIYSTLARGMPGPPTAPQNFTEVLEYVWWRLDKALDREMIEASALCAALYCLKNGVTFIIDHHASPFAIEQSLDIIARAFDRVGVSHLLCYEMSDRDGGGPSAEGLAETERYLKAGNQGHVGLHASFTVGDRLLKAAVELAQKYDTGIHVHVAEDPADQQACMKVCRRRVVERYRDAGVLEMPKSVLAHCIHLDTAEKRIVRDSEAWIVQNVESNQNNNVGIADYSEFAENVMLGTDGMHNDMLRSAKAAFLAGQAAEGIDLAGIYRRFRNVHTYIAKSGFRGDGDNNLVILNYNSPTDINPDNFPGHFVYGLDAGHVDSVISNGELVVEGKKVLTIDEDEVLAFSRQMGNKLWRKLGA